RKCALRPVFMAQAFMMANWAMTQTPAHCNEQQRCEASYCLCGEYSIRIFRRRVAGELKPHCERPASAFLNDSTKPSTRLCATKALAMTGKQRTRPLAR